LNSHATSYSDWYVIDEKEEARLKQIAFEKYMAEKAILQQMEKRRVALEAKKLDREAERKANRGVKQVFKTQDDTSTGHKTLKAALDADKRDQSKENKIGIPE